MKKNKILGVFLFIFLISFVSSQGLELGNYQISTEKYSGEIKEVNLTIHNTENVTFLNLTLENNNYAQMNPLNSLTPGEIKNITIKIDSTQTINKELRIRGFYENTIGTSSETYEVDVDYDEGISDCQLTVIKGDRVNFNNINPFEITLKNSDNLENIQDLNENSTYQILFDNPRVLNYHFTRYSYKFADYCRITAIDDSGLVNNPDFDAKLNLDVKIIYEPTQIELNVLENNFTIDFPNSHETIYSVKNTGNKLAKNINLTGEWMTFSTNNFDLEPGYSKNIGVTINTIGNVFNTNQTNKNYNLNLTVQGNFDTISKDINVFIPYTEVTNAFNESNSSNINDLVDFLCGINPSFCEPEVIYKYLPDSQKELTFNLTKEELDGLFKLQFDNFDLLEANSQYNREQIEKIINVLDSIILSQNNTEAKVEQIDKNQTSDADLFKIAVILIIATLVICIFIWFINRELKKQARNFHG